MKQVQDFIREQHMIQEGCRVTAGVSGGADSVCLLLELLEFQKSCRFDLEVVHIEHGIRGKESLADAVFVENLCKSYQVPFRLFRFDVAGLAAQWKMTVEEAGRKVRYDTFAQVCGKRAYDRIAVAHNLEDQAETILMNLVRGSGMKGLCGMRPVRGNIIRPLLAVRRSQIEDNLREKGILWRVDRTNSETDYTRNYVRLQVMPKLTAGINSRAAEHIAAAGRRILRAEEYMERQAGRIAKDTVQVRDGETWIDRDAFTAQEAVMQEYLLRYCLEAMGGKQKDIGEVHIRELTRLASMENGKMLNLPGRLTAENKSRFLVLRDTTVCRRQEAFIPEARDIKIPGKTVWGGFCITASLESAGNEIIPQKKYTKWFDYDTIEHTLQIRTRQPGDYLTVNRKGQRKTLKRYLIDEKILREERDSLPLFADGSHILWVAGYRISESCKVGENTRRILKLCMEPEKG